MLNEQADQTKEDFLHWEAACEKAGLSASGSPPDEVCPKCGLVWPEQCQCGGDLPQQTHSPTRKPPFSHWNHTASAQALSPQPVQGGGESRKCPSCGKALTPNQQVCSEECYESELIAEERGPQ